LNNILFNQSDFEGQVYSLDLQPGLGAPTSVIQQSFPSDFRDYLWVWVRFRGRDMVMIKFWILFQDQKNKKRILLGKIRTNILL